MLAEIKICQPGECERANQVLRVGRVPKKGEDWAPFCMPCKNPRGTAVNVQVWYWNMN